MGTVSGVYGFQVWFQNLDNQASLQGIVQATPDQVNGGYTVVAKYLGVTGTPNNGPSAPSAVFGIYNGGQAPTILSNFGFHFTLI